jgi:hypothetical protein
MRRILQQTNAGFFAYGSNGRFERSWLAVGGHGGGATLTAASNSVQFCTGIGGEIGGRVVETLAGFLVA